jgi:hypothetical protein
MTTEMTAGRDLVETGLGYVDVPLVRGASFAAQTGELAVSSLRAVRPERSRAGLTRKGSGAPPPPRTQRAHAEPDIGVAGGS